MTIIARGLILAITALVLLGWTSPAPVETLLYNFGPPPDGGGPYARLIADQEGALYGTTNGGGSSGYGTVFKLTPPARGRTGWTETVLYRFCSLANCSDGELPTSGLIADKEGALYGTTTGGGLNCPQGEGATAGCGTVFKLTPPVRGQTVWTETVLYRFCSLPNCSDGEAPSSGLIADRDGALYGTTSNGGKTRYTGGIVYKLAPPTGSQTVWKETVLYEFCSLANCSDGSVPYSGVIAGNEGALYGTTFNGGGSGLGTVFKLSPPAKGHEAWTKGQTAWTETVLYSFCTLANCGDGATPISGLIVDKEGALYGTTSQGGEHYAGGIAYKRGLPPKVGPPGQRLCSIISARS